MNPQHPVRVKVVRNVSRLPQNPWLLSKILIDIHEEIDEFVEDQYGMVTHLGTYHPPSVYRIELETIIFTPRRISQLLQSFIEDTQICQTLGDRIGLDPAFLHGWGFFLLSAEVKLIRQVRVLLPPSVPVLSIAASDHVLRRLVDEQSVEISGLVEEEEEENATSCSICIENFSESSDDENVIRMPRCLHLFHQGCIFEWLKQQNSCPLCRRVPYGDDDNEDVTTTLGLW